MDLDSAPPPTAPSPVIHEPRLPPPERYDGSPGVCRSFLTQCQLISSLQSISFPTDAARVAYIITQLTGKAKKWGTAAWSAELPCTQSSRHFMQEMHRIFDRSTTGHDAGREILRLRQGSQSVSDYAIDFQTLATDSGWEGHALVDSFLNGLSKAVKDELLTCKLPEDLDRIIPLAIRIDSRLEVRKRNSHERSPTRYFRSRRRPSPASSVHPPSAPSTKRGEHRSETEAMMVDQTKLSKEERERWMWERACLYCGEAGHFASNCPVKDHAH